MSGNCGSLFRKDRDQVGNPAKNGAAFVPMVCVLSSFAYYRAAIAII